MRGLDQPEQRREATEAVQGTQRISTIQPAGNRSADLKKFGHRSPGSAG